MKFVWFLIRFLGCGFSKINLILLKYEPAQLHYTNSYTYNHPKLSFLQYTLQILAPHVMWSAQAVRDSKIDHTQRHLSALRGTRSA